MIQKFAGFFATFGDKIGRKLAAALALRSPFEELGIQRFAVGGRSPDGREGAAVSGGGHAGRGRLGG